MRFAIFSLVTLTAILGIECSIPDHNKWLADSLVEIRTVKAGMTRAELLQVFTTEGGLRSPSKGTYTYRKSPHIKVDVEFETARDPNQRPVESTDDRITSISRPYLAGQSFD